MKRVIDLNYADEIKRNISMEDICNMYGIAISRGGLVLCCFHNDKHPSVKVYPNNRGFCCFSCGKSGSIIDWTMQYFHLSFAEACAKLNVDFSLGLPIGQRLSRAEQIAAEREAAKRRAERDRIKREGEQILQRYHLALDRYVALDRILTANKPRSIDDITADYARALKELDTAKYNLEQAEIELYNYEHRND